MPNTFLRPGAAVTSKTDVSRPTALEPVPESVAGDVFAYRGMETHGVEPNAQYQAVPDYSDEEDEVQEYADEPAYIEPVPVRVVQQGGRELRRVRMLRGFATAQAQVLVGGDLMRRKVTIKNMGTDTVYIGHDMASASAMHGWPLAANESMDTDSVDTALWAISSTANVNALAVRVEYSVNLGD